MRKLGLVIVFISNFVEAALKCVKVSNGDEKVTMFLRTRYKFEGYAADQLTASSSGIHLFSKNLADGKRISVVRHHYHFLGLFSDFSKQIKLVEKLMQMSFPYEAFCFKDADYVYFIFKDRYNLISLDNYIGSNAKSLDRKQLYQNIIDLFQVYDLVGVTPLNEVITSFLLWPMNPQKPVITNPGSLYFIGHKYLRCPSNEIFYELHKLTESKRHRYLKKNNHLPLELVAEKWFNVFVAAQLMNEVEMRIQSRVSDHFSRNLKSYLLRLQTPRAKEYAKWSILSRLIKNHVKKTIEPPAPPAPPEPPQAPKNIRESTDWRKNPLPVIDEEEELESN